MRISPFFLVIEKKRGFLSISKEKSGLAYTIQLPVMQSEIERTIKWKLLVDIVQLVMKDLSKTGYDCQLFQFTHGAEGRAVSRLEFDLNYYISKNRRKFSREIIDMMKDCYGDNWDYSKGLYYFIGVNNVGLSFADCENYMVKIKDEKILSRFVEEANEKREREQLDPYSRRQKPLEFCGGVSLQSTMLFVDDLAEDLEDWLSPELAELLDKLR